MDSKVEFREEGRREKGEDGEEGEEDLFVIQLFSAGHVIFKPHLVTFKNHALSLQPFPRLLSIIVHEVPVSHPHPHPHPPRFHGMMESPGSVPYFRRRVFMQSIAYSPYPPENSAWRFSHWYLTTPPFRTLSSHQLDQHSGRRLLTIGTAPFGRRIRAWVPFWAPVDDRR